MSLDKQIVFINAVFERECLTLISPRHSTAICAFTQNGRKLSVKSCLLRSLMKNASFDEIPFVTHELIKTL